MGSGYQVVSNRIGISAPSPDVEKFMAQGLGGLLPSIQPDENAKHILARYEKRKNHFAKQNFSLGLPALALLTKNKDNRICTQYDNMDFYGDNGNAAWRPQVTLEHL